MKANRKWHSTGDLPSEYPDGADMERYLVMRRYPDGRYDVNIEPWILATDFSGDGQITPAHFSYWGPGRLVGWQPLPLPITDEPVGWQSEYRGDDNPSESGTYLCTTTRDNRRFDVKPAYWNSTKARWSPGTLREGEEVVAWRNYPNIPSSMVEE